MKFIGCVHTLISGALNDFLSLLQKHCALSVFPHEATLFCRRPRGPLYTVGAKRCGSNSGDLPANSPHTTVYPLHGQTLASWQSESVIIGVPEDFLSRRYCVQVMCPLTLRDMQTNFSTD